MKIKDFLKKHKIGVLIVTTLILLGGFGIYSLLNAEPAPTLTVAVDSVKVLDIEQTVNAKGNIVASNTSRINSLLNYEIENILVTEGQKIKKGDTLAVLSSISLDDELALSKQRLDLSKLNLEDTLKRSQDSYEDALLNLQNAEKTYNNTLALYQSGGSSQDELTRAQSSLKSSQNLVSTFNIKNGKVVATSSQLKSIELEETTYKNRQKSYDDLKITSPIDGTVTRINAKVGEFANTFSSNGLFLIEDIDNLIMEVMVSEFDISKIMETQQVRITSDILGNSIILGSISKISLSAQTQSPSSTEMVIPVEIQIHPTKERLIAGVKAKAVILVNSQKDALSVPVDSVLQLEDGSYCVLKVDENHILSRISIELGLEGNFYSQIIKSDLKKGDNLVLSPDLSMKEGTIVAISNEYTGDNESILTGPPAVVQESEQGGQ